MKEEKIKEIFKVLEGINRNEWIKLQYSIDRYFDFEASKQANKLLITSPDEMMKFYQKLF